MVAFAAARWPQLRRLKTFEPEASQLAHPIEP